MLSKRFLVMSLAGGQRDPASKVAERRAVCNLPERPSRTREDAAPENFFAAARVRFRKLEQRLAGGSDRRYRRRPMTRLLHIVCSDFMPATGGYAPLRAEGLRTNSIPQIS